MYNIYIYIYIYIYICKSIYIYIIIMLAYLYCAAYTRMTMNELSPPCEQRRNTFNDGGQRVPVGSTRITSATLHLHVRAATNYIPSPHTPSPSRQYYPRLIAGTNLPTQKGWIAWMAKEDCTHITFIQGYYTIESQGTRGNEPRLSGPRPTQYQRINRAVHYRPIIKSQKTTRSAVCIYIYIVYFTPIDP